MAYIDWGGSSDEDPRRRNPWALPMPDPVVDRTRPGTDAGDWARGPGAWKTYQSPADEGGDVPPVTGTDPFPPPVPPGGDRPPMAPAPPVPPPVPPPPPGPDSRRGDAAGFGRAWMASGGRTVTDLKAFLEANPQYGATLFK